MQFLSLPILFCIEINYTSSCDLPFPQFLDSIGELANRIPLINRFQESLAKAVSNKFGYCPLSNQRTRAAKSKAASVDLIDPTIVPMTERFLKIYQFGCAPTNAAGSEA
jgi:hypothetical protein